MKKSANAAPDISGVPSEVRENIAQDLSKTETRKFLLDGLRIGISISDNEDLSVLGYSAIHLKDTAIELLRHLVIHGAKIVYGGDLRKEGYSEVISDLVYQYRMKGDRHRVYFTNYFSYPIYLEITKQHRLDFKKNRAEIVEVKPPISLLNVPDHFFLPHSPDQRLIWEMSLSAMRNTMIQNSDARIVIGGHVNNYAGQIPGIMEEAYIAIRQKKPLYVVGAFGGAARQLVRAIQEKREFSFLGDSYHNTNQHRQFLAFRNAQWTEALDLGKVSDFFMTVSSSDIAAGNGLSMDETERLFVTPHISEIIHLIFKGLLALRIAKHSTE